jgi:uridine kinase
VGGKCYANILRSHFCYDWGMLNKKWQHNTRSALLKHVADKILRIRQVGGMTLVGIDGTDGSGKTVFADELAATLRGLEVPAIRASVDDFHRPRQNRYMRGKSSPEGFYYDSYDYDAFRRLLLEPLLSGRPYCRAMHNVRTDEFIEMEFEQAKPGTVLVVDGIFLHRDELYRYWSFSVFLEADLSTAYERMAIRDGCPPDLNDDANRRYRDGQLIYLRACQPQARASLVIDNNDLQRPKIITSLQQHPSSKSRGNLVFSGGDAGLQLHTHVVAAAPCPCRCGST